MGGAQRIMAALVNHVSETHETALAVLDSEKTPEFFGVHPIVRRYYLDRLGGRGIRRVLRILSRLKKIRAVHRAFKSDIVVSFMDTMNTTTIIALWKCNVPVIAAERTDPSSNSIGCLRGWLRNLTYRYATVVVQTSRIAEYFARRGVGAEIISNPVFKSDLMAATHLPGSDGRFRIVVCGRLSHEKRIPLIIDAFSLLALRFPAWDLLILGDGPQRQDIECQIAKQSLGNRVILAGMVSDIQAAMARCHINAFISIYEGFPNALAEAMALGLPSVACRDVSGVEELALDQQTGLLVDREPSAYEVAAKLEALMKNPSLRQQLALAARSHILHWSPDLIFSKWDRLFDKIADTQGRLRIEGHLAASSHLSPADQ